MALTVPNTFVTGTTAKPGEVNDNFVTIYNAVGSQSFTAQNYISNDQAVTGSLDALDQQVKSNADAIGGSVTAVAFTEQAALPSTVSNQVKIAALLMDGAGETGMFVARENNGGGLAFLMASASHKMWVYRNDAEVGWVIDTTVTDRVLAVTDKVSGTYGTVGGVEVGSWTHLHSNSAHAHGDTFAASAHVHQWYNRRAANFDDQSYNSGGSAISINATSPKDGGVDSLSVATAGSYNSASMYTSSVGSGVTGSVDSGGGANTGSTTTFRPYAAVGTLQYPDFYA